MSLTDQTRTLFDAIFGPPVVGRSGYTPELIRAGSGQSLVPENLEEYDRQLDAEKLDAIKQSTSKGFRILDINPNNLPRSEFLCVYSDQILRDYIGNDNITETTTIKYDNEGSPVNMQQIQSPYWRTVSFPVVGNFLKIEYLPVRQNAGSGTSGNFTNNLPDTTAPQNTTSQINGAYINAPNIAGENMILLDFENPSNVPHVVKNGMIFRTYFNQIYVTFKQLSPLIRITIGVNSEIEESPTPNVQSLALWDGKSYTKNSLLPPKPFCITDKDMFPFSTARGVRLEVLAPGQVLPVEVISNAGPPPASGIAAGLALFWITGFSAQLNMDAGVTAGGQFLTADIELMVVDVSNYPTLQLLERVACINCSILTQTSGIDCTSTVFNVAEPIRISLKQFESLYCRFMVLSSSGSAYPVYGKVQINGYCHGGLISAGAGLTNPTPYYLKKTLTENPYASDLERFGEPNV